MSATRKVYADKPSEDLHAVRFTEGNHILCDVGYSGTTEGDIDYARRIAACWNAFDGIPTEQFEGMDVGAYVSGQAFIDGLYPNADGSATLGLKGKACQLLADAFAGQFIGTGAINFLEVNLRHKEIGDFTVTMQKASGLTPAALKAKAEAERDEAIKLLRAVFFTHDAHIQALSNAGANPVETPEWFAIRQLLKDKQS